MATEIVSRETKPEPRSKPKITPALAKQVLFSLLYPTMLMPLAASTTRVALPLIRDDFMLDADVTAWVAAAFGLPFMALMAVFGRLSDGLGKRRLLLGGIAIFSVGTLLTVIAPSLGWLIAGRAIQGIGGAGLTPLAMALIAEVYSPEERGKALGAWTTVGPAMGFITPMVAGFLIDQWGWRAAFAPALILCAIALWMVAVRVPPGLSTLIPKFAQRFDWIGVVLLAVGLSFMLFYLSSRPITGVEPLRDWRLFAGMVVTLGLFVWYEHRHANPFIDLSLFAHPIFSRASICASLRMFTQSGLSILLPLYFVDIHELNATTLGLMLTVISGSMMLVTRFVGGLTDQFGSRLFSVIGFFVQISTLYILSLLTAETPMWVYVVVQIYYGFGAGAVLVALHRAAMQGLDGDQTGTAAGVYGTVRFAGSAIGIALAGVMLQANLDQGLTELVAYQRVLFWFMIFPTLGLLVVVGLREPEQNRSTD